MVTIILGMALDGSLGIPIILYFVIMLQDVASVYLNGWHARNVQEFFVCFSSIRKVGKKKNLKGIYFSKCLCWINKYIMLGDLLSKAEGEIISLVISDDLVKGWYKMPH